jgi:type I restriction enzyme S subunit
MVKPSLPEQTKIATFLTAVDEKLTALKQKKTLLEQYKKGVMQQIFSQELRFKDDTSTSLGTGSGNDFPDWEEKKLGEVASFFKGKGLPKSDMNLHGKYKCIHYGELFTKYDESITNIISRTDIFEKPFLSIVNDVLMPTSDVTPNGLATASCINEDDVILGGDILVIRQARKVFQGLYFSYFVNQHKPQIMKLVSGSTVYHLYGSDMKNLKLSLPCLEEQTKIANFLSSIDEKINHCQSQIEKATIWKKGLLQQLFV